MEVRTQGDWEGWTAFFLRCVQEAAHDGVQVAGHLFALLGKDRQRILHHQAATLPAVRLFVLLPEHPMITIGIAMELLETTKPTAAKAIDALVQAGILQEITGTRRDRVYAYRDYLTTLSEDVGEGVGMRKGRITGDE